MDEWAHLEFSEMVRSSVRPSTCWQNIEAAAWVDDSAQAQEPIFFDSLVAKMDLNLDFISTAGILKSRLDRRFWTGFPVFRRLDMIHQLIQSRLERRPNRHVFTQEGFLGCQ